jgi:activator of HSP90 ATPase
MWLVKIKEMAKTIVQNIVFKNTKTKDLYDLYMNAKKHTLATGAPAKIIAKEGTRFSAHGDYISGKNLRLIKDKLIVQTWRGSDWNKPDVDSIFMIHLEQKGKDVLLKAVHAFVPDIHAVHLNKGWHDHYWKPWKQYLAGQSPAKPAGM